MSLRAAAQRRRVCAATSSKFPTRKLLDRDGRDRRRAVGRRADRVGIETLENLRIVAIGDDDKAISLLEDDNTDS